MTQPEAKHEWYDVKDMGVEGKGWTEMKSYYDRLPAKAEGVVRDVVWQLSRQPAGRGARPAGRGGEGKTRVPQKATIRQ